jgi:hypothetical protein
MANLKEDAEQPKKRRHPATTPDARENQVIALAYDLAEKQLSEGTASSQVIAHFLKLGSSKERVEKDILISQRELIQARTEAMKSGKRIEELYEGAIKAMKAYTGHDDDIED